jgi:cytochrome c-type biogenesis protein
MIDSPPILAPTFLSVWLMGVSVGLTSCAATCLPFLGTWSLGRGRGGLAALGDTGLFLAGKIVAYAGLGAGAGWLGSWLGESLNGGMGHLAIGLSSLFAGLWLMATGRKPKGCQTKQKTATLPPFFLGFSMSLVPCAPLASLMALSALTGDLTQGAGFGALFGLGTALTPLLIMIPLLGFFGRNLTFDRPWLGEWLRWGAGITLCLLGLRRLLLGV